MHDYRVASRYAKSLLLLAEEQNILDQVHSDILIFSELCGRSRELVLLLQNPIIKHEKKRAVLKEIFSGKIHPITASFFDIICKKNREKFLVDMAKEFHHQYNVHNGIESAASTAVYTNTLVSFSRDIGDDGDLVYGYCEGCHADTQCVELDDLDESGVNEQMQWPNQMLGNLWKFEYNGQVYIKLNVIAFLSFRSILGSTSGLLLWKIKTKISLGCKKCSLFV